VYVPTRGDHPAARGGHRGRASAGAPSTGIARSGVGTWGGGGAPRYVAHHRDRGTASDRGHPV